jgi:hypothetical protein
VAAPEKDLDAVFTGIEKSLVLKRGEIISSTGWVRYLGREYQATPRGFRVRIPAKYYERLLQEMGMMASRPVSTPFPGPTEHKASAEPMNAEQLRQYRRAVGKMLWMLGERPDLAFQVKELARAVSGPTGVHWATLKRVLRYVQATLDMVFELEVSDTEPMEIKAVVDASWAPPPDRKSTSGGTLWLQGFSLAHWSRTQAVIAQSSCEAELMGLNTGAVEAKLLQTLLGEMGLTVPIVLYSDSTSGVATTARLGPGRMRHLAVKELWLQEEVHERRLSIQRVSSVDNIADVLTKALPRRRYEMMKRRFGLRLQERDVDAVELGSINLIEGVVFEPWTMAYMVEPLVWMERNYPDTLDSNPVMIRWSTVVYDQLYHRVCPECLASDPSLADDLIGMLSQGQHLWHNHWAGDYDKAELQFRDIPDRPQRQPPRPGA